jgi:hypothetical protein
MSAVSLSSELLMILGGKWSDLEIELYQAEEEVVYPFTWSYRD